MSNWPFFDRQATHLSGKQSSHNSINRHTLQPSKGRDDIALAQSHISYIIGFSILSPVVAYSYTGRFKALGMFIGTSVLIICGIAYAGKLEATQSKSTKILLALSTIGISVVDNSLAVALARRRLDQSTESMK